MRRPAHHRAAGVLLTLAFTAIEARAQAPAAPPGSAIRGSAAALVSPAGNPYLNPVLNPGLLQNPAGRDAFWLSILAANNANGGLGSGRISGARSAVGSGERRHSGYPRELTRPGAGASRYFNRAAARPAPRPIGVSRQARYRR